MGSFGGALRELDETDSDPSDGKAPVLEPPPPEGDGRVTPVMPIPDWLRELDEQATGPARREPPEDTEDRFWNEAPRYSVVNFPSLMPLAPPPVPSRLRVWGARLVFCTVFCAVVALLGFETASLLRSAGPTRSTSGLQE
ncbi:MAG TPA: hypothetical protein VK745_28480 [Polyangiaceae bacterium]|nr:hypothetical protein [Polyangiaceae bacterium]